MLMIMLRNKNNIYVIFILKYLLILTLTPELENERFLAFFDSCKEINAFFDTLPNIPSIFPS